MIKFVYFIVLIALFFSACSGSRMDVKKNNSDKVAPFLFRMNAMYTDAEKFVSFPIWLNDSLVAKYKIKKMTRSLYFIDLEDSLEINNLQNDIPREKREYWFFDNGQLKELNFSFFYDDEQIGIFTFLYKSLKDKYGYADIVELKDSTHLESTEDENVDFPYKIHQKARQTEKYLAYQDNETGNYLFYMLNKKNWGSLSIDSILKPTQNDIIVLGKPLLPAKQYRVINKVNERDVQQFKYNSSSNRIETILRQESPFENNRTLMYNQNGYCNGYIDSTFSGKLFLTRIVTEIKLDKLNRPIKVIHRKENQQDKTARISIELIKYE